VASARPKNVRGARPNFGVVPKNVSPGCRSGS
jgi:hypothetical protein